METQRGYTTVTRHLCAALIGLFTLCSLSFVGTAHAETAAGTIISNTVYVTWTGGSDDATATLTVALKPTAPNLTWVSNSPVDLTNDVGEAQSVTIDYTLTSQANGVDNYTLAVGSTDAGVNPPTGPTINNGVLTVDLGASMAKEDVNNSTAILIPGTPLDHGLGAGDLIYINGTPYTISSVELDPDGDSANGPDTELTISAAVTIGAGTGIYEYIEFSTVLTTGTLTAATGTHEVKSDAYVTGIIAEIDTDTRTITVRPATLTVAKAVDNSTPQPGDTVTYTIDVANTGNAAAANVLITDAVPDFTIFAGNVVNGGCTDEYSIDNGGTWDVAPGDLTTVTDIRFDCGSLAGGAAIQVEFDVTIE